MFNNAKKIEATVFWEQRKNTVMALNQRIVENGEELRPLRMKCPSCGYDWFFPHVETLSKDVHLCLGCGRTASLYVSESGERTMLPTNWETRIPCKPISRWRWEEAAKAEKIRDPKAPD